MARRSQTQRLDIWMNGLPVGYWEKAREGDRLSYRDEWIEDEQGRPLSLSMPFTPGNLPYRGDVVSAFFDNLLPDSDAIRRRLAQRHRTGSTHAFDLLVALGRDCVGAIQLLPPDEQPTDLYDISGTPLSDPQVAQLLRNATAAAPLGQYDSGADLRLSIAGAQEKTALLRLDDQWIYPAGSTPTTHIFKLPLGLVGNMQADMRTSIENEWLCSKIVSAYGLPAANCEVATFEDQKALVVERFDRRLSSDASWIVRLPQEDMCQATGRPSHLKYQADDHGRIARLGKSGSRSAAVLQDPTRVLATGSNGWACEKLQHFSFTWRVVPVDATLRRALRTSDHWPGTESDCASESEDGDGRSRQCESLSDRQDSTSALDCAGSAGWVGKRDGAGHHCRSS
jgi:serine/threonine-protein kinase HipA